MLLLLPGGAIGGGGGGGGAKGGRDEGGAKDKGPPSTEKGRPELRSPPADLVIADSPYEEEERACVAGNGAVCREVGLRWRRDEGERRRDFAKAENLLRAGCYFHDATSCLLAARMYLSMEAGLRLVLPKGTPELDFGTAAELLDLACGGGALVGCGVVGDLRFEPRAFLSSPEARWQGVERDTLRARQSWELGCPALPASGVVPDARSCFRLGELYGEGRAGVQPDPERAETLLARACSSDPTWCARAAETQRGASRSHNAPSPPDDKYGELANDGGSSEVSKAPTLARIDATLQIGPRWNYGRWAKVGPWLGVGTTIWANVVGVHIETGWWSDRPFEPADRTWSHYVHALGAKLAVPLPVRLPIPARLVLGGVFLGHVGHLKIDGGPASLTGGASQGLWMQLTSAQESGPRQWFSVEFAVSETRALDEDILGSRFVVQLGLGGGGEGPRWGRDSLFTEAPGYARTVGVSP